MCQRENETVKFQIEQLLNYAVKTIKNRKRTKQVLASVKVPVLLCGEFKCSGYSKNGSRSRKGIRFTVKKADGRI